MSTEEQKQSLDSWFAEYDRLSMKGDVEGMADMAMFPVHVEDWRSQDLLRRGILNANKKA